MKLLHDDGTELDLPEFPDDSALIVFTSDGDIVLYVPEYDGSDGDESDVPGQIVAAGAVARYISVPGVVDSLVDKLEAEIEHDLVEANTDAIRN